MIFYQNAKNSTYILTPLWAGGRYQNILNDLDDNEFPSSALPDDEIL